MPKGVMADWPERDVFADWWADQSVPVSVIAERVGCAAPSVSQHAKKLGLPKRSPGQKRRPEPKDPVLAGHGRWVPRRHGILYWEDSA